MRTWWTLTFVSSALFLVLSALVYAAPHLLETLDALAARTAAPLQTDAGITFFLTVTALGGGVGIVAVAVAFTYLARLSMTNVFRLVFLMGAVLLANKVLKEFFARARPEALEWFEVLPSFSFPSAHATSIMALYGFIAVVLYRRSRGWAKIALPLFVIVLVGASRVVLGAHYLSDVLGGYLLGFALLALTFALPFGRVLDRYA